MYYRDVVEIIIELDVIVYQVILNHWGVNYSPLRTAEAKNCKRAAASYWRVSETGAKVKGRWGYCYHTIV
jgi:transposase-like protein